MLSAVTQIYLVSSAPTDGILMQLCMN